MPLPDHSSPSPLNVPPTEEVALNHRLHAVSLQRRLPRIIVACLLPLGIALGVHYLSPRPDTESVNPSAVSSSDGKESSTGAAVDAVPAAEAGREVEPVKEKEIPTVQPESNSDVRRRLLCGVWQDEYKGRRTMTLNADGTGTMLVELSGLQATLFASRLRFDMVWSLEGDVLIKKTLRGEPASKVNLILKTLGDTAHDRIVELTSDRLLLLDQDGHTQYDWKRVLPE